MSKSDLELLLREAERRAMTVDDEAQRVACLVIAALMTVELKTDNGQAEA